MFDTIAAISTSLSSSAISIIRVSGKEALEIVNKIFDRDIYKFKSNTINYGHIINENKIIDEVLVSIFLSPKTYTREDIVEINSHGGIAVTNKILELLLNNGARLAEPGEFTKRAFLNGRIDLIEAESIMDLIESKTESARKLAINGVDGKISKKIKKIRDEALNLMSNIEVNIDYPEYEDIEVMTREDIKKFTVNLKQEIEDLIDTSKTGKIIKEGLNVAIIGKPNVGKSSILNKILDEDKAIVTDIPGTTRDIVEGSIRLNDILVNFVDTAGIRDTNDVVEKIGVNKSINQIDKADLILLILNNNQKLSMEDKDLIKRTNNKNRIIIVNKADLESNIDIDKNIKYLKISAKNDDIDILLKEIIKKFDLDKINNNDMTYISSARVTSLLKKSNNSLNHLIKALNDNIPIDLLEIDIKDILNYLGEITGDSYDDELIDKMFSRFCLGK